MPAPSAPEIPPRNSSGMSYVLAPPSEPLVGLALSEPDQLTVPPMRTISETSKASPAVAVTPEYPHLPPDWNGATITPASRESNERVKLRITFPVKLPTASATPRLGVTRRANPTRAAATPPSETNRSVTEVSTPPAPRPSPFSHARRCQSVGSPPSEEDLTSITGVLADATALLDPEVVVLNAPSQHLDRLVPLLQCVVDEIAPM